MVFIETPVFTEQIMMVFVYAKNAQSTLTPDQKKALRSIVEKWR